MGAPDGWYAVQDDGPHPTAPEEEERMTTQRDNAGQGQRRDGKTPLRVEDGTFKAAVEGRPSPDAGQDFLTRLLATEVWADDSGTFPIRTGKLRAILSALDVERQQVSVQARARRLAEAECASLKARLEHEGALVEKWRIEVVALRRDLAEDEPDNSADDPQHSLGENPMTTQRDDAGQDFPTLRALASGSPQPPLDRQEVYAESKAVLSALAARDAALYRERERADDHDSARQAEKERADYAESQLAARDEEIERLKRGIDQGEEVVTLSAYEDLLAERDSLKRCVEERDEWWRAWAWQLFDAAGGTVSAMYFFNAFDARRASEEPSHE